VSARLAGAGAASGPAGSGALEPVLEAVLAAVAPQPVPAARRWWVTADRTAVEVHAAGAPHLALPMAAATRVAAGAAVLAVRLAMAATGFRPVTALLPEGLPRSVVAIVRRGPVATQTRVECALFTAMLAGCGTRPPAPVAAVRGLLRSAADAEGVRLRTAVTPEERARLRITIPSGVGAIPEEGIVALLGTDHDVPVGDLQAGQALQRVLWTATALGLAGTVLAGPVELAGARTSIRQRGAFGVVPQVLVHVGAPGPLTGPEDPPDRDRSHCRRPGRPGEPRDEEVEEGQR
jgi:hypothetical protein